MVLGARTKGSEISTSISRSNRRQALSNSFLESIQGESAHPTQKDFEFGKGFLDGAQIWAIGWQEQNASPCGLNESTYLSTFVDGEVINDDNLAWMQVGAEKLSKIGFKSILVYRAFNGHGRSHALHTP